MQAAGELAEFFERLLEVVTDAAEHCLGRGRIVAQRLLGHPQVQGEGDEALLGAVVQVPFQAPPLGDARLDHPRARVPHLVELGAQLCEEALVLECEPGCAGDGVQERGVLAQRRVVDERGDLAAVPLEDRHGTPGSRRDGDRVARPRPRTRPDRGSRTRAPVRDRAALGRWRRGAVRLDSPAQFDDQVADPEPAHAGPEQPDEIGDRHHTERQSLRRLEPDRSAE